MIVKIKYQDLTHYGNFNANYFTKTWDGSCIMLDKSNHQNDFGIVLDEKLSFDYNI